MPFSYTNKSAGDLIRSQDWNAAMAAIAALYDKLNGTTGHGHTGTPEDGPQIGTPGLADLAVTFQKLADLAVTTPKIQNGAVDNTKLAANAVGNTNIQNGVVTLQKMAANSVGSSQIVDLSVTTNELGNASVTAQKLAPGAVQEFGFTVSSLQDGQTAPVPAGFLRSECIYHCAFKYLVINMDYPGGLNINSAVNATTGVVSVGQYNAFTGDFTGVSLDLFGAVNVLTIAKKGGWVTI